MEIRGKITIVLVQMGTPRSLDVQSVRQYLKAFLGNRRVIDKGGLLWKIFFYGFLLVIYPYFSLRKYQKLWRYKGISEGNSEKLSMIEDTKRLALKMHRNLHAVTEGRVSVRYAFLFCSPTLQELLAEKDSGSKLLFLPQFPQYSESTTAFIVDEIMKGFQKRVNIPCFEVVTSFYDLPEWSSYIAKKISTISALSARSKQTEVLILSYHGIPRAQAEIKRDLYIAHCEASTLKIRELLQDRFLLVLQTYHSKWGRGEWVTPSLQSVIEEIVLMKKYGKVSHITLFSPSFTVDSLETQIDLECDVGEFMRKHGMGFTYVPAIGADDEWAHAYSEWLLRAYIGVVLFLITNSGGLSMPGYNDGIIWKSVELIANRLF
ncbi:MAG: ferrochelatase [Oligoflexia bacterium]|nr:ferrochelatase [Oligoflexia bacterium]MBF0367339.1 ferrochelatase [Oligoflexia bacterium]